MYFYNTIQCGDMAVTVVDNAIAQFRLDYVFPSYIPGYPGEHLYAEIDALLLNDQRVLVHREGVPPAQQKTVVVIMFSPLYPDGLRLRLTANNLNVLNSVYLLYKDQNGVLHHPVDLTKPHEHDSGSKLDDGEVCEFVLVRDNYQDVTRYKWYKMVQQSSRIDM